MKKKRLKSLTYAFTLVFAFTFTNDSFSQSSNDDWILVKDSINVKFYYKTVLCDNHQTILYKIASSNPKTVNLNWTTWGAGTKEIISINQNEEKTGSCELNNKLSFKVLLGNSFNKNLPIVFTEFN